MMPHSFMLRGHDVNSSVSKRRSELYYRTSQVDFPHLGVGFKVVVGQGGVLNVGVMPQPVSTQPPNLIPQELILSIHMVLGVHVGLGGAVVVGHGGVLNEGVKPHPVFTQPPNLLWLV